MIVNNNYATKCVIKSKTWFDIGKLIYFLSKGSNEGYKLWIMYSKMDYENFKEQYCYELWSDFDCLMNDEPEDLPEDW